MCVYVKLVFCIVNYESYDCVCVYVCEREERESNLKQLWFFVYVCMYVYIKIYS